jgi:hypothetical protein
LRFTEASKPSGLITVLVPWEESLLLSISVQVKCKRLFNISTQKSYSFSQFQITNFLSKELKHEFFCRGEAWIREEFCSNLEHVISFSESFMVFLDLFKKIPW